MPQISEKTSQQTMRSTAQSPSKDSTSNDKPTYTPPTSGILSILPAAWVPYSQLARIEKPTGIYLFYFPHLFGTLYARSLPGAGDEPSLSNIFYLNALLFAGTVFMRAAACSWNDTLDREYDRQVRRCMLRPIAQGALTPLQGHLFTAAMTLGALGFLSQFPLDFTLMALPSIVLLVIYPFAKRFTRFPQLVLGFQVGIAFFLGIAATGYNLRPYFFALLEGPSTNNVDAQQKGIAMILFYFACVSWTGVYDTVYAQQDLEDDLKAGVKSMAITFKNGPKTLLSLTIMLMIGLLAMCGVLHGMEIAYLASTCGITCISLAYMVITIDLKKPEECWWWFKNNCWVVGIPMALGLLFQF